MNKIGATVKPDGCLHVRRGKVCMLCGKPLKILSGIDLDKFQILYAGRELQAFVQNP